MGLLAQRGVLVEPLQPSNCGFDVGWSELFPEPICRAAVEIGVSDFYRFGREQILQQGEFVVTADGVEGGLIYKMSALLREQIAATGSAVIYLDLAPGRDKRFLLDRISQPRGKDQWQIIFESVLALMA